MPITAVEYVEEFLKNLNSEGSDKGNSSSTFITPVLKPYLPVIILDLVGVQVGYAQTLSNIIPLEIKLVMLGVVGFFNPKL